MREGFVFLDKVLRGVRWDAKYATWDNFVGKPIDGYCANRIVGTKELAHALLKVKKSVATQGYGLLLWDAYRPQRAAKHFLKWSLQPEDGLTKAKYYPNIERADMINKGYVAEKSSHSRGSAVDLTLYRLNTDELMPMGGGFDFMDERSHHGAKGILKSEMQNRCLLRTLMEESGFEPFEYEWWHYVLKNEPYPDSYFDFIVA